MDRGRVGYLHVVESGDHLPAIAERLQQWFGHHYANPSLADDVVVTGSAAACAEQLRILAERGVDAVIVHPVLNPMRRLEALAAGVLPLLERAVEEGPGLAEAEGTRPADVP